MIFVPAKVGFITQTHIVEHSLNYPVANVYLFLHKNTLLAKFRGGPTFFLISRGGGGLFSARFRGCLTFPERGLHGNMIPRHLNNESSRPLSLCV